MQRFMNVSGWLFLTITALGSKKDITMNRRTLRTLRIAAMLTAVIFGRFSGLNAANVPIYPTGVNDNYQLLAGGTPDPHYQISAGLNNGNQGVVLSNLWPAWDEPADAKWIFVENSLSERGSFNMQTTFDLTGYDPSTAMIVGKWSADDDDGGIFLNGTNTGNGHEPYAFTSLNDFTITSGFQSGINTLTFAVTSLDPYGYDGLIVSSVSLTAELASALPGDFNGNGVVDAADYVVWRKGLGTIYTAADYNIWRAHFGQHAGNSALAATSASDGIPEPASLAPLLIVGTLLRIGRTRKT